MSYESAKAFIRRREGGAYHPTHSAYDPNPTMWGITEATYHAAGFPGSVYEITEVEWDAIFQKRFWRKAGCHLWPEPLDLVVADPAFNSGPKQALKFLQRAVSATADGVFGPETTRLVVDACTDGRVTDICIRVQGQRVRFLKSLYAKSLERIAEWEAAPTGPKPKPAPISNWIDRVDDLARTVKLY